MSSLQDGRLHRAEATAIHVPVELAWVGHPVLRNHLLWHVRVKWIIRVVSLDWQLVEIVESERCASRCCRLLLRGKRILNLLLLKHHALLHVDFHQFLHHLLLLLLLLLQHLDLLLLRHSRLLIARVWLDCSGSTNVHRHGHLLLLLLRWCRQAELLGCRLHRHSPWLRLLVKRKEVHLFRFHLWRGRKNIIQVEGGRGRWLHQVLLSLLRLGALRRRCVEVELEVRLACGGLLLSCLRFRCRIKVKLE